MRGEARTLGIVSGFGIVLLSIAYGAVTVIGLGSLAQPTDPIGDPWFSAMEALILLLALPMLGLMGSIHASARDEARIFTRTALVSMAAMVGLTCSLHLAILSLGHDPFAPGASPSNGHPRPMRWTSLPGMGSSHWRCC